MRRNVILILAALVACPGTAIAETTVSHGISAFGELKYKPDFKHFDYVYPNAPKGGSIDTRSTIGRSTFDNFNPFIARGDGAVGADVLLFDSLMTRAYDEPDAVYGLVAKTVEMPEDRSWALFTLRPEAVFSDGTPLTAEDVAFSIESLRDKGAPRIALPLRAVENVTVLASDKIKFTFAADAAKRDLAALVAEMPIFSKAEFEGKAFDEPERGRAPLGSGPYKVGKFKAGEFVTYIRRDDYWAKNLPVNVGHWNFDEIQYWYFTDGDLALENFKAGELDLTEEFRSLNWATKYDFPAIQNGYVKRESLPDGRAGGTQGFWLNTRKPSLQDPFVREAIGLAFDFEWSNEKLFYGLYIRTDSFFENTADLQATGMLEGAELALLEPFRGQVPESVFTEPAFTPPVSNGSGFDRKLRRKAQRLLKQAGWNVVDGMLRNATGARLTLELLDRANSNFDRIAKPFIANLRELGIDARLSAVDRTQYEKRVKDFDYDIIVRRYAVASTPGPAIKDLLSSETVETPDTYNVAAVASPAIDHLLEVISAAKSRAKVAVAARAIDRVFRAGHYWVPNWYKASHSIAYWDRFGRPQDFGIAKPPYKRAILRTWWVDPKKASRINAVR